MVGRRWSKFVAGALTVATAMLVPVPGASAEGEPDTGAFNAFNLKASHGYRVMVLASSTKEYRNGRVLIAVSRKGQEVNYFAPAQVTDTSVEADLGALGRIDVTFQPSGEKGVAHPICDRSQRVTYSRGSYVGTIDLRGEEGYTRVRAESAPYSLHPFIDFICPGYSHNETFGHGVSGARLRARMKAGGERIELQVNQNRPGARVRIGASTDERRGEIWISREVTSFLPAASFGFAPDLRVASLRPPAPFSGSAHFLRTAAPPNRWTGSLALDFPGRSNVSLAGTRFRATLVHARLIKEDLLEDRPNLSPWDSTNPSAIVSLLE